MKRQIIALNLLLTIFLSTIAADLIQTAQMLLKGETIEFVYETDESNEKESKSKKLEAKDSLDKFVYSEFDFQSIPNILDAKGSNIAKSASLVIQNFSQINDLPPEA